MELMERDIHLTPKELLSSVKINSEFGDVAIFSGSQSRVKLCLKLLKNPIRNFSFLDYFFYTGIYRRKKISVGKTGISAPETALLLEMLLQFNVKIFLRIGSCGTLRRDISIGDLIIVEQAICGEGVSKYYIDREMVKSSFSLTQRLFNFFSKTTKVHKGVVWSTSAPLRETKEFVNENIKKRAIAVDMVSSAFLSVSNFYKKEAGIILVVTDNLITGEISFKDKKVFEAQKKMVEIVFKFLEEF